MCAFLGPLQFLHFCPACGCPRLLEGAQKQEGDSKVPRPASSPRPSLGAKRPATPPTPLQQFPGRPRTGKGDQVYFKLKIEGCSLAKTEQSPQILGCQGQRPK